MSAVDEGEECCACDCWVADCEGCACCCILRLIAGYERVLPMFVVMCFGFFIVCGGCSVMCFDVFVVERCFFFFDARCCRYGQAPIHEAASGGHLSCLEFLVGRNADVNARDE